MKIFEEEIVDSESINAVYIGKIKPIPKPKVSDALKSMVACIPHLNELKKQLYKLKK